MRIFTIQLLLFKSASVEEMRETREVLDKTCIPVIELIEEIEIKFKLESTAEILLSKAEGIQCQTQGTLQKKTLVIKKCQEILKEKVSLTL